VCDYERKANCKLVSRVEVIDENGRGYVKYLDAEQFAWLCYQDGGRTLKVFIDENREEEL
jgi:hypothetical protein